jgi:hypothetical protein
LDKEQLKLSELITLTNHCNGIPNVSIGTNYSRFLHYFTEKKAIGDYGQWSHATPGFYAC